MKIAIIGAGSVGGTLGRRWGELGHVVTFGVRDPNDAKGKALVGDIKGGARIATVAEAAAASDIVVLATPWQANAAAIASAGNLAGKILIDVTNPLKPNFEGLAVGFDNSGAEEVAKLATGARTYKALNQTGWENMADPIYPGGPAVMFVAGDEPAGKAIVLELVAQLGFEAIDAGDLKIARLIEPYAMLWVHLMAGRKLGRRFAFGLMRKDY